MRSIRCSVISGLILLIFSFSPEAMSAQIEGKQAKVEKLFDDFLRRGDFPGEFQISIYRTTPMGLGLYLGTISVRNSMITIGGRDEPALILKANLQKLTPGPHAFHIHANPDCGPKEQNGVMVPGLAAGPHLFAGHKEGVEMVMYKSHLGNLPNLTANADGTATEETVAPRLTLADLVNRSIMIHATQDDNSARMACGVFK